MLSGPCQPRNHNFPSRTFGTQSRRFSPSWFDDKSDWLEYSIKNDALFCLYCYLFKPNYGQQSGGDSFVGDGFSNWKKKDRLKVHVGGPLSAHNEARRKCDDLMNPKQHIQTFISKQPHQSQSAYRVRLNASVDCVRFLLRQGLAFRGSDESKESNNQGNFLELLQFLANHNEAINSVTLENARKNLRLTSPDIQKDITNATASETLKVIINDIGDSFFSIMVDESHDISMKEQMSIVLRYVNQNGRVIESFVGIEHVSSTTALSLKDAVDKSFSRFGLSTSKLRGQGYDGASNMQGEFKGLKTLILKENQCAYYIHCFAHQLQLALVAVARKHIKIASFFALVTSVVNVVGASSKRNDALQEKQANAIDKALVEGQILSGRGKNQQVTLKRPADTRWSSHYDTLLSLISMFAPVIEVLDVIVEDGANSEQRCEANHLLDSMLSFDFMFSLHLMRTILGITNDLSKALQRKDQDIVNAMSLVGTCKKKLQLMRDNGWDSFSSQVSDLCHQHKIEVVSMDSLFIVRGRPRRKTQEITNLHQYRAYLFYSVIDMQLQELNDRFTEVNTELLLCISCLSPDNKFSAFDKKKLIRMAEFYPSDFSSVELLELDDQLETYIMDMLTNKEFTGLRGINELAEKMVQTKKSEVFSLVYMLVTLALILPVATATVERSFSAMNIVKNRLRNRIGDGWMNDYLVTFIEKDVFNSIDNKVIMQKYQRMKPRKEILCKKQP